MSNSGVLTSDGSVLCWGFAIDGRLGPANMSLIFCPTELRKAPQLTVGQMCFSRNISLFLLAKTKKTTLVPKSQTVSKNNILASLECPVCLQVLSRPIHLCVGGHSLCAVCKSKSERCSSCDQQFIDTRNLTLESLIETLILPCEDCSARMPASRLNEHSTVCPARKYGCLADTRCGWSGRPDAMVAHMDSAHPGQLWRELPHSFLQPISPAGDEFTNVVWAHGRLFTVHRRYDDTAGELRVFCKCIGPAEDADKYRFKITLIQDDNEKTTLSNNTCVDTVDHVVFYLSSHCTVLRKRLMDSHLRDGHIECEINVKLNGGEKRTRAGYVICI